MAVTTLRSARPGSTRLEESNERGLAYERYLRSSKVDLMQRRQSTAANNNKDVALTDIEIPTKSGARAVVEPLEWIENDVPVSTVKSNASVQTDSGPPERRRGRSAMSARFRTASCPGEYISQLPQRPKTAAASNSDHFGQGHGAGNNNAGHRWSLGDDRVQVPVSGAAHSPSSPIGLEDSEKLARAFMWSTATQRGYDDAGWEDRFPSPLPPTCTLLSREPTPDPVTPCLNIRRYHSTPEIWQIVTPEWDFVQTRVRSYGIGPPGINYCSPYKQQQQLPGYLGCVPGREDADFPASGFSSQMLVRSLQPHNTSISRRANIPGYMGHTHWTKMSPPHSANQSTTSRTHRHIPLEEEPSPFIRSSPLSKMVTLVSPHNPFKRIE